MASGPSKNRLLVAIVGMFLSWVVLLLLSTNILDDVARCLERQQQEAPNNYDATTNPFPADMGPEGKIPWNFTYCPSSMRQLQQTFVVLVCSTFALSILSVIMAVIQEVMRPKCQTQWRWLHIVCFVMARLSGVLHVLAWVIMSVITFQSEIVPGGEIGSLAGQIGKGGPGSDGPVRMASQLVRSALGIALAFWGWELVLECKWHFISLRSDESNEDANHHNVQYIV
jgi:heme exporter protein D